MSEETISAAADQSLPGVVLARAIRRNIVAGALGSLFGMTVMGFFLAGYADYLKLDDFQLGFMAAVPMLVFPIRLLASYVIEHLGHRKNFFSVTAIASRLVWIAILALPFYLHDKSATRSVLFLSLYVVSAAIGVMAEPAWHSWMADLIPETMRARFWSKRSIYVSVASAIPLVFLALAKDSIVNPLTGFAVVFGFAVLVGVIDIIIHYGIPEPPMTRHGHKADYRLLFHPIKDPKFRPFLIFNGAWTFSMALIGFFGFRHFFEVIGQQDILLVMGPVVLGKFAVLALITLLNACTGILGYSVWGMLVHRYGSKPILQACTFLTCLTPLPWLLVTPEHPYWPTVLTFVMGGFSFPGINVGMMNLLYGLSPKENRSMYIAINLTVAGLCGAVSPILAGAFMKRMNGEELMGLSGFYLLCIITSMARLYTRTLLYRVQEGSNITPGYLIRRLTEANPFRVFASIYSLAAPATEDQKVAAVERLAKSRLGTQDLVEHLDDPSPKVREEAVLALAKSKDPEAVDALIDKLSSREHGLELQSARALGEIGDERGVQPLIDSLNHPDPRVRATAAQALGAIGDRRASEPLFHLLEGEEDELTFTSYATALSALNEVSAIWHMLPVMRNTESVIFRRQLAVAIGNLLGEAKVFYGYLDEECKVFGQRVGKLFNACRRLTVRKQNNPLGQKRHKLLSLMTEAENAYIAKSWQACAISITAAANLLTDIVFSMMVASGRLQPDKRAQDLDEFEKIFQIIGKDERLGMQLWYSAVLSPEQDPEFEKLTFEGCLLDIYALSLAMEYLFKKR